MKRRKKHWPHRGATTTAGGKVRSGTTFEGRKETLHDDDEGRKKKNAAHVQLLLLTFLINNNFKINNCR